MVIRNLLDEEGKKKTTTHRLVPPLQENKIQYARGHKLKSGQYGPNPPPGASPQQRI